MFSRRNFIKQTSLAGVAMGIGDITIISIADPVFSYVSPFIKVKLLRDDPRFLFFSTDNLGKEEFNKNPILKDDRKPGGYESKIGPNRISYFIKGKVGSLPAWECEMKSKSLTFRSRWIEGEENVPLSFLFSQKANYSTVLGEMERENIMKFPCLLHLPGMGSFEVTCSKPSATFFYDGARHLGTPYIQTSFPAADADQPEIVYQFKSVAIYPKIEKFENDARFDGFKRNYLNVFQINPRIRALANNSASDACAFTLFIYAEMAKSTPPLFNNYTAIDLIKSTLNRYFEGMLAYGQVGYGQKEGQAPWNSQYDSLDTAPSLVIAACYAITESNDLNWARENYSKIHNWAQQIIENDKNDDGIIEYGYSGNSGSWDGKTHPANWWDTIGFGHDDAYSNALAYHACSLFSVVAKSLNLPQDKQKFSDFSDKLKSKYFPHFYNPETGVLGGWRSKDGELHDYYFTFVNSIAVCYGLIDGEQAKSIMRNLINKMKEVGYKDFSLGLPGNLIPVNKEDYTHFDPRWGYDKFQVYENGGATSCYAYFMIHALFKVGLCEEAEAILLPMLESFKKTAFEGTCAGTDMTKDWKTWEGECWGYEGFLVDNYLTLKAVLDYGDH